MDPKKLLAEARMCISISLVGIIVPGIASALLALLFSSPMFSNTSFLNLVLFLTVSLGMSALPVLARILSERRLLATRLGGLAMAVAAVDDIIGWCLLAITVALISAKSSIDVLYTLLLVVAYILAMVYVVRPVIHFLVRRDAGGTLSPDTFLMLSLILIGSSYVADIIGLSYLIGAFIVGLLIPRTSTLAALLSERLEAFVVTILMPLFFTNRQVTPMRLPACLTLTSHFAPMHDLQSL